MLKFSLLASSRAHAGAAPAARLPGAAHSRPLSTNQADHCKIEKRLKPGFRQKENGDDLDPDCAHGE